jgi:hypothetical protein
MGCRGLTRSPTQRRSLDAAESNETAPHGWAGQPAAAIPRATAADPWPASPGPDAISLAEAKAPRSERAGGVAAGEASDITRQGKAVATLAAFATPRKRMDAVSL